MRKGEEPKGVGGGSGADAAAPHRDGTHGWSRIGPTCGRGRYRSRSRGATLVRAPVPHLPDAGRTWGNA